MLRSCSSPTALCGCCVDGLALAPPVPMLRALRGLCVASVGFLRGLVDAPHPVPPVTLYGVPCGICERGSMAEHTRITPGILCRSCAACAGRGHAHAPAPPPAVFPSPVGGLCGSGCVCSSRPWLCPRSTLPRGLGSSCATLRCGHGSASPALIVALRLYLSARKVDKCQGNRSFTDPPQNETPYPMFVTICDTINRQ